MNDEIKELFEDIDDILEEIVILNKELLEVLEEMVKEHNIPIGQIEKHNWSTALPVDAYIYLEKLKKE